MKKRILSILLALCMCLSMLPTAALATGGSSVSYITAEGSADLSYESDGTTNLLEYIRQGETAPNGTYYLLRTPDNPVSNLTFSNNTTLYLAVPLSLDSLTFNGNALVILGDGVTLTVNGVLSCTGNLTITTVENAENAALTVNGGVKSDDNNGYGIYAGRSLSIYAGTIDATGGIVTADNSCSYGIFVSYGSLTISGDSTSVTATGGAAGIESAGIFCQAGVDNDSFSITGGKVEAFGGTATSSSRGIRNSARFSIGGSANVTAKSGKAEKSYGIYTSETMTVSGTARLTAKGDETNKTKESYGINCVTINIGGNAQVTAEGGNVTNESCGIYADGLSIASGTVKATGGTATSESTDSRSYGICAKASVSITGGSVTATSSTANSSKHSAYSYGIYANSSVAISDSTVTAYSGTATASLDAYNYGICAKGFGDSSVESNKIIINQTEGKTTKIYGKNSGPVSLSAYSLTYNGGTLKLATDSTFTRSLLSSVHGQSFLPILPTGYTFVWISGTDPVVKLEPAEGGIGPGIITLSVCDHTDNNGSSARENGMCKYCGNEATCPHTNIDAETGYCSDCARQVPVKAEGADSGNGWYDSVTAALAGTSGSDVTITLCAHTSEPGDITWARKGTLMLNGYNLNNAAITVAGGVGVSLTLNGYSETTYSPGSIQKKVTVTGSTKGCLTIPNLIKFTGGLETQVAGETLGDYLNGYLAYYGDNNTLYSGNVTALTGPVSVSLHFCSTFDKTYTCTECGKPCPHTSMNGEECLTCGYICTHETVDETGTCTLCKHSFIFKRVLVKSHNPYTTETAWFDTLPAALDGLTGAPIVQLHLYQDYYPVSVSTAVTLRDLNLTLYLNGHILHSNLTLDVCGLMLANGNAQTRGALNGTVTSGSSSIFSTVGSLNITGLVTLSGFDTLGADVILNGGVKTTTPGNTLLNHLNSGLAFSLGSSNELFDGSVTESNTSVTVIPHPSHTYSNTTGKCACGAGCPHTNINAETGYCSGCARQVPVKAEGADSGNGWYDSVTAALAGTSGGDVTFTLYANCREPGDITWARKGTLKLNGYNLDNAAITVAGGAGVSLTLGENDSGVIEKKVTVTGTTKGCLKITSPITFRGGLETTVEEETLCDYLGENLLFQGDGDIGFLTGSMTKYEDRLFVSLHTIHHFVDGTCSDCGYVCTHETVGETGICTLCRHVFAIRRVVSSVTAWYDTIPAALEGFDATTRVSLTLYQDVDAGDLTISRKNLEINLNGCTLKANLTLNSAGVNLVFPGYPSTLDGTVTSDARSVFGATGSNDAPITITGAVTLQGNDTIMTGVILRGGINAVANKTLKDYHTSNTIFTEEYGGLVDDSLSSISTSVMVISHTDADHVYNKETGKCPCGKACPHTSIAATGMCEVCRHTFAVKRVASSVTTWYDTVAEALNGVTTDAKITLYKDVSADTLTVSSGNVTFYASDRTFAGVVNVTGGSLTLNGGTYNGNVTMTAGSLSINAGTFTGTVDLGSTGTAILQRGTFAELKAGSDLKTYLAEDCAFASKDDTSIGVPDPGKHVRNVTVIGHFSNNHNDTDENGTCDFCGKALAAYITEVDGTRQYFETLSSALSAVRASQTLTLLRDITINAQTISNANFDLDLNGKKILGSGTIEVAADRFLTLKGTGTSEIAASINVYGTLMVVEAVKLGNVSVSDNGTIIVDANAKFDKLSFTSGTATLNSGTFTTLEIATGERFTDKTFLGVDRVYYSTKWLTDADLGGFSLSNVSVREAPIKGDVLIKSTINNVTYIDPDPVSYTYGEEETFTALVTLADGYTLADATYKWDNNGASLPTGCTENGSTLTVKFPAADNYNFFCTVTVDGYSVRTALGGLCLVGKAELYDGQFNAPVAKTDLTYNGKAQELCTAGVVPSGATMKYSLDKSTWTTTVPTAAEAGSYTVYWYIEGGMNYFDFPQNADAPSFTAKITKVLKDSMVTVAESTYNGRVQTAPVTVKDGDNTLVEGRDYTITGNKQIAAGSHTLTITGKGIYSGTVTKMWKLRAKAISNGMVSLSGDFTYDGNLHTPAVTVAGSLGTLLEGTDYALSGTLSATEAGTYYIVVTGIGGYSGTITLEWRIEGAAPPLTWTGSGTAADPYVIDSADELSALAYVVNHFMTDPQNGNAAYSTLCYQLGGNVDFENRDWTPIGDGRSQLFNNSKRYASFAGVFDGNGKTVSGLSCTNTQADDVGLFGRMNGGVIRNATVANSTFTGQQFVGGIVGQLSGGTVENCTSRASVSGFFEGIGGIAGGSYGTIRGCTNAGTVSGTGIAVVVGGIVGGNYGTLTDCTNTGSVSVETDTDANLGGITGWNNGTLSKCTNSGTVTGSRNLGGIAGYCTVLGSISECENSGTVNGGQNGYFVGGIVGINESSGRNGITLCANTGAVSGKSYVGGIAGKAQTTVENCYNTAMISGESYVGGIAGMLYTTRGKITNCHSIGTLQSAAQVPNFLSAVAGYSVSDAMQNNYYCNGYDQNATQKTAAEFADGTVLNLLGTSVWSQGTACPVLRSWSYRASGSTITASSGSETDTLTISAPAPSLYYNGNAHAAVLSAASVGGVAKLPAVRYEKKLDTQTWSEPEKDAPVDAGTYRASITVGGVTASVEYTIQKATVRLEGITVRSKTYDGTTDAVIVAGTLRGVLESEQDKVSVTPATISGTFADAYVGESKSVRAASAADLFELTGNCADNYAISYALDCTGNITAASQTVTPTSQTQTILKNDLGTDISGWAASDVTGAELIYTLVGTPAGITLDGTTLTAADADTTVASFTIKVSAGAVDVNRDGTSEYNASAEQTITVATADRRDAGVTISNAPASKTYGDSFTVTASVGTGVTGGTWSWTTSDDSILAITGGADSATVTVEAKKADTTGAKLTVTYTSNTHYGTVTTAAIPVAKKAISITGVSATARDYDGTKTVALTGGELVGKVTGDDLRFTLGSGTAESANAGTQNVTTSITLTGTAKDNYTLTQPTGITVTIRKADPSYTVPTGLTATYGQTLADVSLSSHNGWSWMDATQSVGNASDTPKNFKAAFTPADTTNYNVMRNIDVPVTVGKADPTAPTGLTGRTGNKLSTVSLPTGWAWLSGETVMSESGSKSFAASYTDTTGNYHDVERTNLTVTVSDKEPTALAVSMRGWTYGEAANAPQYEMPAGASKLTVVYKQGETTLAAAPTDAGDYTVHVSYETLTEIRSGSAAFTIAQAVPTGEPKYTAITVSGKTLADAKLNAEDGAFSVPGTVKWVDADGAELPDTTKVTANTAYAWVFTPNSSNYSVLRGVVTLWRYAPDTLLPGYAPSVPQPSEGGSVSVSPAAPSEGDRVTITPKPDDGYEVDKVIVTDKDGNRLPVKTDKNGSFSFLQPEGSVTIRVTYKKAETKRTFVDVPKGSYFEAAVAWAVENGITSGTDATHFSPNASCTRAQAVTFLWRAAGCPKAESRTMPFTDVTKDSYYYEAVLWALENGITQGTGTTTFSPDDVCTRSQIVTFLWRSMGKPEGGSENPFRDVKDTAYYAGAVLWAVREQVTTGTGKTTFSSDADCTRAQIVTFIYRAMAQ